MMSDYVNRRLKAIEKVSKEGKKVKGLFDLMLKKEIWFQAYENIAPNKGAMTKGPDEVTQDRFSEDRVENLIKILRTGQFQSKAIRRTYIPKTNGKLRPLGIPAGDDKLVQEVTRIILDKIYEPIFSTDSHGFRAKRSCHTALKHIRTWTNTKWFIEFDIKGYFDNIDHKILLELLGLRVDDRKFLNLIKGILKAGILEEWKYRRTYSGTPQGGVSSPLLANIYLHELDTYVDGLKEIFNTGDLRRLVPEWTQYSSRISYLRRKVDNVREIFGKGLLMEKHHLNEINDLMKLRHQIPSRDPYDPNYRRLWYCRYADDFVLGFIGPKTEAMEIKELIQQYLKTNLKLDVSERKTGISKASESINFLNYAICTRRSDKVIKASHKGRMTKKKTINGQIKLFVPMERVTKFCESKRYGNYNLPAPKCIKPRPEIMNQSEVEIILLYNAEIRGFANYYALADDVKKALHKASYMATYSCLATLAAKHKTGITSMAKIMRKGTDFYWKFTSTQGVTKEYRIWQLKHLNTEGIKENIDVKPNSYQFNCRTELGERLLSRQCEHCKVTEGYFEVHHIKSLKDLQKKPNLKPWEKVMIQRRRKTLILCVECHDLLHAGKLPNWNTKTKN